MLFRLVVCALLLATVRLAAQSRPPVLPPLDAKAAAEMEGTWQRLSARDPNLGARRVYEFLLGALARNWRPETWPRLIALGEELHDHDPASPTYGNYRWYWREAKPNDRNAVEFSMQAGSLAWVLYRDRLTAEARRDFAASLALGAEGMLRHKVEVSYTNIFLMRLANCILLGEGLDRPDLVRQGRAWFDEWFAYTRTNGIHEYSSPTYYGTDLTVLGALANYSATPAVRTQAIAALRLLWTDIAANWFDPFAGIAGAHSRDYGFLTGHGYLDQALYRAGWLKSSPGGEAHAVLDDLTFLSPPAEWRRGPVAELPRVVGQRFGPNSWERATHYVGREFTLGSAGAGYGPQDRTLALTLAGGPMLPIINFALDYHDDPYGQAKLAGADGHAKLTHLLPFVTSVQRGPEVVLLASYNPATARSPIGGRNGIAYTQVSANFVIPAAAQLYHERGPLPAGRSVPLSDRAPLFLRHGRAAVALMFIGTRTEGGDNARIELIRDGDAVGAQRLSATLAKGTPKNRLLAAVWVRATEGIGSDDAFRAFQSQAIRDAARATFSVGKTIEVSIPGLSVPFRIAMDPAREQRLAAEGADLAVDSGILTVNGRDVGGPALGP